ncbi:MAG: glycosyltransferase [Candidatus Bathyarchaeota archaeon]|nr:glycosyltransferase [Candidatus Bathyarchaeota archaeon]
MWNVWFVISLVGGIFFVFIRLFHSFKTNKLVVNCDSELVAGSVTKIANPVAANTVKNSSKHAFKQNPKVLVVGGMTRQFPYITQYVNTRFVHFQVARFAFKPVPKVFIKLVAMMLTFRPNIVLVYPCYPMGSMTVTVAKLFRKKHITFAFGNDLVNRRTKIGKMLVSYTVRNSDGVICDYNGLVEPAKKMKGRNVVTIPMGIEVTGMPSVEPKKLRNTVISVINFYLAYSKGIDLLIQAVKRLPDVHLVLVGKGLHQARLMDLAKKLDMADRVTFTGFISREELCTRLLEANVYALPIRSYNHEGTNRSVVEAMFAGLPVVVTNVGGLPSIIDDCVNGFVIEPDSVEAISTAISKLLSDEELCKKMGKNNRAKAKKYVVDYVTKRRAEYLCSFG